MATANQRVPVLMTAAEKAQIVEKAKKAGLSMGEYMRRAAQSYRPLEDDKVLEVMIEQMVKATERADIAIEEALSFVEASKKRIANMEVKREVT